MNDNHLSSDDLSTLLEAPARSRKLAQSEVSELKGHLLLCRSCRSRLRMLRDLRAVHVVKFTIRVNGSQLLR